LLLDVFHMGQDTLHAAPVGCDAGQQMYGRRARLARRVAALLVSPQLKV
jgi:hypothetical protein